jgi:hypothetical protein
MSISEQLILYIKSLGLVVNTHTKARGHQGFFMNGRIDISEELCETDKCIPILLHEFAHYIHSTLEKNIAKTGGNLDVLFCSGEDYTDELLKVTNYVDKHSTCDILLNGKRKLKYEIKNLDSIIKKDYPNFQRSKRFNEFEKAIKHSDIKYLKKYDIVCIKPKFIFGKDKIISVENLEKDFPNLKPAFCSYLKLLSLERKQKKITRRINALKKYYKRPTELFARFVEGLYIDKLKVRELAPKSYYRFFELLENGYYGHLKNVYDILNL